MSKPEPPKSSRTLALKILQAIEQYKQKSASEILSDALNHADLTPTDRALVTEVVYGVLRHRTLIDFAIKSLLKTKRPPQPVLQQILRIASYQILFLDRVPAYAAVNEAVSSARNALGRGAAGFVNAILRKIANKSLNDIILPYPDKNPVEYLSLRYSHPRWMVDKFIEQFGIARTEALLSFNNEPAPITLRVNTLKTTLEELIEWIHSEHPEAQIAKGYLSPQALNVRNLTVTAKWTPLKKGWLYVQDEASQLIAYLAKPSPGMRIVDYCSAPGGKLTHIAELVRNDAHFIALDINEQRLKMVRENCQRLGVKDVLIAKVSPEIIAELKTNPADIVIADVPCSALGTIRRHPDIKWRKTPKGIARLPQLQLDILENAASLVRKEGRLIYCTCTLIKEENEEVVKRFLQRHPEFTVENPRGFLPPGISPHFTPEGYLFAFPPEAKTDGFFAVRLKKRP